jgi:hypothetical protein
MHPNRTHLGLQLVEGNQCIVIDDHTYLFEGKIYFKNNIIVNNNILKQYLYAVNQKKIEFTTEQLNMSFIDIIYNNHEQWQVGYTGTAYLKLNDYQESENFVFKEIKKVYDEVKDQDWSSEVN